MPGGILFIEEKLPGVKHYLKGSQPAEWQTHVPTYERVRARDVYPGIDVVYYGHHSELEFDLILQPGAAPSQPQLHFRGAKRLSLNADGELVILTSSSDMPLVTPSPGTTRQ